MKSFKLVKIYRIVAANKADAVVQFRKLEEVGSLDEALVISFVKEDEPKGFFAQLKKQVFG